MKKGINTVITFIILCFFFISVTTHCQATDISENNTSYSASDNSTTEKTASVDSVVGIVIAVTVAIATVFIIFIAVPKK